MRRIDPWSVLKFSLVFSLSLLVVFVVAVAVLYLVLNSMGVFDSVNNTLRDLTESGGDSSTGGLQLIFSPGRIIGYAAVIGAVNAILFTALATIGAFLYNLCSELVGGLEVTLAERE